MTSDSIIPNFTYTHACQVAMNSQYYTAGLGVLRQLANSTLITELLASYSGDVQQALAIPSTRAHWIAQLQQLLASKQPITDFLNSQREVILIGVDEVGRGCMFGPVVAAASCVGIVDYQLNDLVLNLPKSAREQLASYSSWLTSYHCYQDTTNSPNCYASVASSYAQQYQLNNIITPELLQSYQDHTYRIGDHTVNDIHHSTTRGGLGVLNPWYQALGLGINVFADQYLRTYLSKRQDSKQISEKRRDELRVQFDRLSYVNQPVIISDHLNLLATPAYTQDSLVTASRYAAEHALSGILLAAAEASAQVIDEINIANATYQAMHQAVMLVITQLQTLCTLREINFEECIAPRIVILVDGNKTIPTLQEYPQVAIVKGDSQVREISVASIYAKTHRDHLVLALAQTSPYDQYGLVAHKGYITKQHVAQIQAHGITDLHRKSFSPIKDMLATTNK